MVAAMIVLRRTTCCLTEIDVDSACCEIDGGERGLVRYFVLQKHRSCNAYFFAKRISMALLRILYTFVLNWFAVSYLVICGAAVRRLGGVEVFFTLGTSTGLRRIVRWTY